MELLDPVSRWVGGHGETLAGATLVGDDVRLVTGVDAPPGGGARVSAAGAF